MNSSNLDSRNTHLMALLKVDSFPLLATVKLFKPRHSKTHLFSVPTLVSPYCVVRISIMHIHMQSRFLKTYLISYQQCCTSLCTVSSEGSSSSPGKYVEIFFLTIRLLNLPVKEEPLVEVVRSLEINSVNGKIFSLVYNVAVRDLSSHR